MAITQNPLIGRAKNKIGNVVMYTQFKNNVIRSKPIVFRDLNSVLQRKNRLIFFSALRAAGIYIQFAYYLKFEQVFDLSEKSLYSYLMSKFKKMHSFDPDPSVSIEESIFFVPGNMVIGKNEISALQFSSSSFPASRILRIEWDESDQAPDINSNMLLSFLLINTNYPHSFFIKEIASVGEEVVNIELPYFWNIGNRFQVLCFLRCPVSGLVSSSGFFSTPFFVLQ